MRMLVAVSKLFAANPKLAATILASVTLMSFEPAANALTYSTSGAAQQFSLGDTLGTASNYDQLQILGAQGTIGPNTSNILLNTLIFTAGPNAIVPAVYNNIFSFKETVTIGTGTASLVVPFNLSINYSDTLTIVGGTKLSILVGANLWNIVVNGLTIGPNSGGSETGYLTAQVSDPPAGTPLPAALVLFGSGLGAMGLFGRRRKSKASAVLAA
jgi:hypothetical protein